MAIELKLLVVSFMVAATLLQGSEAATSHVVLDNLGQLGRWIVPPGGSDDYVNWAAKQSFELGDSLYFNYTTGEHDVAEVSKTAYEDCTKTNPISNQTTGPTNITLSTVGEHHYICSFGNHCNAGQKLLINVIVNSTTSTLPPSSAATPLATAALPMIALFSIVLAMFTS